jgi:hypothetical protein
MGDNEMRRLLLCLLILPALVLPATANSLPAYMYAAPGLELAVDRGCPIVVDHEDLVFDFSGGKDGRWSPLAEVKASYTMTNPAGEPVSVTMAFPFVTSFDDPNTGVASVRVDGEEADFKLYYGGKVEEDADLSALNWDRVLSNVLLESPPEPEDGTLYTIVPDTSALPDNTESIYIRMTFELESGVCYFDGFNGFAVYEDGTRELDDWFYLEREAIPPTVFVSGGNLKDCKVRAYKSPNENAEPLSEEQVRLEVQTRTVPFREYAEACWENYASSLTGDRGPLDEKLYWAMLREIDYFLGIYYRAIPVGELISYTRSADRLAMAVYTVDFAPGETRNVTINCALEGVMERPAPLSGRAVYTYTYLSNPARAWAEFGTLDVRVIPPEGDMSLSATAPNLKKDENGHYTAKLNGLPEENISFTLKEPAAGLKEAAEQASRLIWFFMPIIVIAAAVIALIVSFVRRIKRKTTGD